MILSFVFLPTLECLLGTLKFSRYDCLNAFCFFAFSAYRSSRSSSFHSTESGAGDSLFGFDRSNGFVSLSIMAMNCGKDFPVNQSFHSCSAHTDFFFHLGAKIGNPQSLIFYPKHVLAQTRMVVGGLVYLVEYVLFPQFGFSASALWTKIT